MKNVLAVLVVVLLSALSAGTAQASTCLPIQQSPIFSSTGTSCAQAQSNVYSTLINYANCECGFCSQHIVYQACESTQYGYLVKGYIRYSCKACPLSKSTVPSLAEFLQHLVA